MFFSFFQFHPGSLESGADGSMHSVSRFRTSVMYRFRWALFYISRWFDTRRSNWSSSLIVGRLGREVRGLEDDVAPAELSDVRCVILRGLAL